MASYPGYAGPMGTRSPIFGNALTPPGILGLSQQQMAERKRKNQIGGVADTLTALGIGLMGQGPSTTPQNPLQGLSQGLGLSQQMAQQRRGQQADDQRMDMAAQQFDMQKQQFAAGQAKDQREQMLADARQAEMERLIAGLPTDHQQAARADPDTFFKSYAEAMFPKATDKTPKIQTIRRGNQDESGFFDENGKWNVVGSGAAFAPRQENTEYGLQPFITKDEQGNLHAWQLSKTGGMQEIPVPQGQSVTQQISMFDNGTAGVPVGKLSGPNPAGVAAIPKDIAGEASAKAQGTAQGEAAVALPTYANSAQTALQNVDDLLSDKNTAGREWATGTSSVVGSLVPGTPGYDFKVNLDKLRGGVFLQAYQQLKGAGAITEVEGKKAEQAIAAMDAAQSEPQFVTALTEYKKVIQRGLAVARQKAIATPVPPGGGAPAAPADGDPLGLFTPAPQ